MLMQKPNSNEKPKKPVSVYY